MSYTDNTTSPTPSPTPRTSMIDQVAPVQQEVQHGMSEDHGRSVTNQGWSTSATQRTPVRERMVPPTLEEIEAMEARGVWVTGEDCVTPASSMYKAPASSQPLARTPKIHSRQVSRVSGTGHTATHTMPTQPIVQEVLNGEQETDRSERRRRMPLHRQHPREEPGPRLRPNVSSTMQPVTEDEPRRPSHRTPRPLQDPVSLPLHMREEKSSMRVVESRRTGTQNEHRRTPYARGASSWHRKTSEKHAGSMTRLPIGNITHGNDKMAGEKGNKNGNGACTAVAAVGDEAVSGQPCDGCTREDTNRDEHQTRRRSSAPDLTNPDFAHVYAEVIAPEAVKEAKEDGGTGGSPGDSPSATCWGGGLPPKTGLIAQGPPGAKVAAARAPVPVERFPERRISLERYPASDRDSFARTLNSEELEEVWQGLGEGVSQRGAGSEVNFPAGPHAASPRTSISGSFPKLTANALQQLNQLASRGADSGQAHPRSGGSPNVIPIPKTLGDKDVGDVEAGTRSSKKSNGSSAVESSSLVSAIVTYGMLLLWLAHLVFNVLLLWQYLIDDSIWALCFLPGILGILLSIDGCCRAHRCKTEDRDDPESRRPAAPHACALPAHLVLLVSVVVALAMHSSALLYCWHNMELFVAHDTVSPLCDGESLLLPIILDCVLLAVSSLKSMGEFEEERRSTCRPPLAVDKISFVTLR